MCLNINDWPNMGLKKNIYYLLKFILYKNHNI